MASATGLRERKKELTRRRIAEVAAALFARHGYDAVTMLDVAREAEVSDQTVYNHFPTKQDLVLDRAEQVRTAYREAVLGREPGTSPASALLPLVRADVERYRGTDLDVAQGDFVTQCVVSPVLRRFALEERERQTEVLARALVTTDPELPEVVAHVHVAGIVAAVQAVHDRIGRAVAARSPQRRTARAVLDVAETALASLARCYDVLVAP